MDRYRGWSWCLRDATGRTWSNASAACATKAKAAADSQIVVRRASGDSDEVGDRCKQAVMVAISKCQKTKTLAQKVDKAETGLLYCIQLTFEPARPEIWQSVVGALRDCAGMHHVTES